MEATSLDFLLVLAGGAGFIITLTLALIGLSYKKVPQGKALVRTGVGATQVLFDAGFVIPLLHQSEYMDITVQKLELKFEGSNGLLLKDNQLIDAKIAFFLRVNPESVREAAMSIGCEQASNLNHLEKLFAGKLANGVRVASRSFTSTDIYDNREEFDLQIRMSIGTSFQGFVLEDVNIEYLQQLVKK